MKTIAVIPARGRSKGIPYKNIVALNGCPLIAYTIKAAKKSGIFEKIIVSTEDEKIKKVARRFGAEVIMRPKKLAQDMTATELVILHVLQQLSNKSQYIPDVIILLQPTSPLRNERDIRYSFRKFLKGNFDSLLSVTKNKSFIWSKNKNRFIALNYDFLKRPRRQDIGDQFKENGAIYITKHDIFLKYKNRLGGKIGYYEMNEVASIDIDVPLDIIVVGQILKCHIDRKE